MYTFQKKHFSNNFPRANRVILESLTHELVNSQADTRGIPLDSSWTRDKALYDLSTSLFTRGYAHRGGGERICTLIPWTASLQASTLRLEPWFHDTNYNCYNVLAIQSWWPIARPTVELRLPPPHVVGHFGTTMKWINCSDSKASNWWKTPFKCFLIWPSSSFDWE